MSAPSAAASTLPTADSEDAPLRVLVVDAAADLNRLLRVRLRARGYQVESATNGAEGIEAIGRFRPDLMICDVSMPVLDGLDLLDRVRSDGHDLAVVMATAFGSGKVAIAALRRGVDDDLGKPLEPVEFQVVFDLTVARRLLARQNRHLHAELDENRRQLEAEVARAAVVQARLLPQAEPNFAKWDVAAVCIPAGAVGGDVFDWWADGHSSLTVTLGDVMGKGMAAALLMATVRAALRAVGIFRRAGPAGRCGQPGPGHRSGPLRQLRNPFSRQDRPRHRGRPIH
ncbi:MAG TPA: response regulator [Thermomicrobiales bacterium]|nr:response regulator [Thermomicrobiales bacterium]